MMIKKCQKTNFGDVFLIFLVLFMFLDSLPLHCRSEEYGREGRKLFSGYNNNKIASDCKVNRAEKDNEGSTICIFKHECIQRGGEVVGRCMDGFLFAACCQLKSDSQYHIAKRPAFVVSNDYTEAETSTDDYDEELAWNNSFKPVIISGYRPTLSQPPITTSNSEEDTKAEIISEGLSLIPEDYNLIYTTSKNVDELFSYSKINYGIPDTTQGEKPIKSYYSTSEPSQSTSQDITEFNQYPTDTVDFGPKITDSDVSVTEIILGSVTTYETSTNYATDSKVPSSTLPNKEIDLDLFPNGTPTAIVIGNANKILLSGEKIYQTQSTNNPNFDDKTEMQTSNSYFFATTEFNPSIINESIAVSDNDFDNNVHEIETTPILQEDKLKEKLNLFFNALFGIKGTFKELYDTGIQNKNPNSTFTLTTSRPPMNRTNLNKTEPTNEMTTFVGTTSTEQYEKVTTEGYLDPIDYNEKNLCGIRPLIKSGRIVGGRDATFGAWPWQVIVRETNYLGTSRNRCGGVLITDSYVITAGHCHPGFLTSQEVVFGEHDISGGFEPRKPVIKRVRRFIAHPGTDFSTFENDIALLELESPVKFDAHIIPICLPPDDADFTSRLATVTGWGQLKYGGDIPAVLQEVQVPVMENSICQEMYKTAGHKKNILDSFLCAGYKNGGKDACEGDSGNPLVLQRDDGRWELVGTSSHGIKCAAPNLPGIYMRTTFYKPWLQNITEIH